MLDQKIEGTLNVHVFTGGDANFAKFRVLFSPYSDFRNGAQQSRDIVGETGTPG
jgi:hypothetical protein